MGFLYLFLKLAHFLAVRHLAVILYLVVLENDTHISLRFGA
jgi:hypothetical protein